MHSPTPAVTSDRRTRDAVRRGGGPRWRGAAAVRYGARAPPRLLDPKGCQGVVDARHFLPKTKRKRRGLGRFPRRAGSVAPQGCLGPVACESPPPPASPIADDGRGAAAW